VPVLWLGDGAGRGQQAAGCSLGCRALAPARAAAAAAAPDDAEEEESRVRRRRMLAVMLLLWLLNSVAAGHHSAQQLPQHPDLVGIRHGQRALHVQAGVLHPSRGTETVGRMEVSP